MTAAPSHLSSGTNTQGRALAIIVEARKAYHAESEVYAAWTAMEETYLHLISPAIPSLQAHAGEWDKGEHEGCGVDSQRALDRFNGVAQEQQFPCRECDNETACLNRSSCAQVAQGSRESVIEECAKVAAHHASGWSLTPGGLARQDTAEEIYKDILALSSVSSTDREAGK